jgi:hypothetical protein
VVGIFCLRVRNCNALLRWIKDPQHLIPARPQSSTNRVEQVEAFANEKGQ